jgi:hypothetical protein
MLKRVVLTLLAELQEIPLRPTVSAKVIQDVPVPVTIDDSEGLTSLLSKLVVLPLVEYTDTRTTAMVASILGLYSLEGLRLQLVNVVRQINARSLESHHIGK